MDKLLGFFGTSVYLINLFIPEINCTYLEEVMNFTKTMVTGVATATAMLVSSAALADYPEKPVKIMVGFSAGGGTDTTARGFASYMHEAPSMNGLPAYIVNLPGASGQKAAKEVLGEDADGHTLYMINIGTFIAGELAKGEDRPYHIPDDFVNLGCASQLVTSLQVHSSNPATTLAEYIENVKEPVKKSPGARQVQPLCMQPSVISSSIPTVYLTRRYLSKVDQRHVPLWSLNQLTQCWAA